MNRRCGAYADFDRFGVRGPLRAASPLPVPIRPSIQMPHGTFHPPPAVEQQPLAVYSRSLVRAVERKTAAAITPRQSRFTPSYGNQRFLSRGGQRSCPP